MATARARLCDFAIAVLLGIAAASLHAATLLGRIYGNDGAMLADWTALPERAFHQYHNTLYLPAAAWLGALLPGGGVCGIGDALWVAKSLSACAGAVAIAFSYACCRLLGAGRPASVAAAVLLAVTPFAWFFAVAIEVHALHFAIVAFAAWVTLAAPWRRPALAMAITAAAFVLPYLSHQSAPVLGPGWILLVQCARRRQAAPFAWRTLFGVGLVLLAALVFGHMLVEWRRGRGFHIDFGNVVETVDIWRRPFALPIVWQAVVAPLAVLLPLAVVAAGRRAVDPWLRATALVVYVPLTACVLWWGIAEQGGYLLGPAFLLAALAAAWLSTLPRRVAVGTALAVIAAQAFCGWQTVHGFDREGFQLVDRAARVHAHLGETGLVVSCNDNAPQISIWLPGVQELNLGPTLANDVPVATWEQGVQAVLQGLQANERFFWDRSWSVRPDLTDRFRDAMARFEAALRRDWRITELPDASWPAWRCERR